jgi:hypothetical protein
MGRISTGSVSGTPAAHSTSSSRVNAVMSASPRLPMSGAAASGDSRVPWQAGQTRSTRKRLTRASRFSSVARLSSSVTVSRALRNVKSSSRTPFLVVTLMCFFSSGPSSTMARSQS